MANLTPTEAALNRSTPGFDSLVQVLHSSADRIRANRDFAKEVQARKDFAQFQADLQVDAAVEQFERLSPLRIEEERKSTEIRSDAQVDVARRTGDVEIEQEIEVLSGPLGEKRLQNLRDRSEIENNYYLDRLEAELDLRQKYQTGSGDGPTIFDLQDREVERLQREYPRATREHGTKTPMIDEENNIQPITINIGGVERTMGYREYEDVLRAENQRLTVLERFKGYKDDIDQIARGSVEDENLLGKSEIEKAVQDLTRSQNDLMAGDYDSVNKVIQQYNNKFAAYLTKDEKEDRRYFAQTFNIFKSTGRFSYAGFNIPLDQLPSDPTKAKEMIKGTLKTYAEIREGLDDDTAEALGQLESVYYDVQDTYNNIGSMVPNTMFNPENNDRFEEAFMTKSAMAEKIYKQLTSNDPASQANRHYNPASVEIERMRQGIF